MSSTRSSSWRVPASPMRCSSSSAISRYPGAPVNAENPRHVHPSRLGSGEQPGQCSRVRDRLEPLEGGEDGLRALSGEHTRGAITKLRLQLRAAERILRLTLGVSDA